MNWSSIISQGGSALSGSGLLNTNLNSVKKPSNMQERLDAFGSGITGEDPTMRLINTAIGTERKNVSLDLKNWADNPNINNSSDLLNAYDNLSSLKTIKPDSAGRLIGDNLLASAQGAVAGSSFGPWGALIGGIAGGVNNLVTVGIHAGQRDKINSEIQEANMNKFSGLSDRMSSINKVDSYLNKANVFAMGGNLTEFNAGGSHEQNPNGGIPQGIGSNGQPNTVEEGEVKANAGNIKDYVFSNRILPTKQELSAVNLPEKYNGKSLADIAKILGKESKERPYDNISKRGLEDSLNRIKAIQEYKKAEMQRTQLEKTSKKFGISPEELMASMQEQPDQNQFAYKGQMTFLSKDPYWMKKPTFDSELQFGLMDSNYNVEEEGRKALFGDIVKLNNDGSKPLSRFDGLTAGGLYKKEGQQFNNQTNFMMNAPLYGGLGMLGAQLAKGIDYSNANRLAEIKSSGISQAPLNDYMKYTPVDNNIRTNTILSDGANLKNRLLDSAGNNGALARASLLAANKGINASLGKAFYEDNNINFERRKVVSDFNRGTNQANSELGLKISTLNKEIEARNNEGLMKSILLREQLKSDYETGLSSTYSNIFQNMGEIGKFKHSMNSIKSMFGEDMVINPDGTITIKPK